jgi:predicted transcriptional regulator/plasmid stabilization system protein ParE
MTISLSVLADEEIAQGSDDIAAALRRRPSWIINDALENYIECHREQAAAINRGIEDSNAGRFFTTEQVKEQLALWKQRGKEDKKRSKAHFRKNAPPEGRMKLRWSLAASHNLQEIYGLIAKSQEGATKGNVSLMKAAEHLLSSREMGSNGRVPGTRELIHPPFLIVYRALGDVINIEAVLDGRRKR